MNRPMPHFLRNQLNRIRGWQWKEVAMLIAALIVLICIYSVIELTDEVKEGETRKIDEWILLNLRRADDPAVPIGPPWLREAGLDLTALGGAVVLVLMVSAVVGFMWLQRRYGLMLFTVVTIITGAGVAALLKYAIARDRPDIVPHLREVTTPSFPSGHAMLSAIVYLTLGTLLMQVVPGRGAKLYFLTIAMLLTFLVGVSRIYLGVHYPTDVLAGWMAGIAWALGCWMAARYWRRWTGARKEVSETGEEE